MNSKLGTIINRLTIGFIFAFAYQVIVAVATSILSIPLTGNISDLFIGLGKITSEEGILLIVWWIISTIIITGIALGIVKYKKYFSPYRNENNIDIPARITVITAIIIGAIISFMFFLMDTVIGFVVGVNAAADLQAIYESASDGNFLPLYVSIIFSIVTGFIIVGITSKTEKVKEITKDLGLQEVIGFKRLMQKTKTQKNSAESRIGLRPDLLIHVGEKKVENVRIDVIEYDLETLYEKKNVTIEECLQSKDKPNVSWINIIGIHDPKVIETFGNSFKLHPLHQANIMNTDLRPYVEIEEDYITVMLKMPHFSDDNAKLILEQITIVISKNFVLTFQEIEKDFFDNIRERIKNKSGNIRKYKTDYLAYAILDAIVDSYFLIIEQIGNITDNLEEELIVDPTEQTMHTIYALKRQMISLRKSIWPTREVLDRLEHETTPLISKHTKTYLRDVYNHTVQVMDTVESIRDMIGSMLDTYLSSVSNKMNQVMKTLTIIASIFIPITFIAGIYGTNFEYIPELQWHGSYFVMIFVMLIISLLMLAWFKKRDWL